MTKERICKVCGDGDAAIHYGGTVCSRESNCCILPSKYDKSRTVLESNRNCKPCRLRRCIEAGMKARELAKQNLNHRETTSLIRLPQPIPVNTYRIPGIQLSDATGLPRSFQAPHIYSVLSPPPIDSMVLASLDPNFLLQLHSLNYLLNELATVASGNVINNISPFFEKERHI